MRSGVLCAAALMTAWGCVPSAINESGRIELAPGDREVSVVVGGRTRRAIVHVPPAASDGGRLPLVIAFHGGGGEAEGFKADAGLDAVADREGFLVAYPFGTGVLPRRLLTWNAGTACCGYARENEVDDVTFTVLLIDRLARVAPVDLDRVYATGHSNGSMMAYRLAAERADRIAAVVAVAGAMDLDGFSPSRPVPVLHVHSVDDPRAIYGGGVGPPFPLTDHTVRHRPVEDGLERWAERNGCGRTPDVVDRRVGVAGTINAGQTATRLTYAPCASGAPVEHWRLTGVGHGWPGATDPGLREGLIGPPTTLIEAAEVIWAFARRFSR